jgi:hypothetical protein
VSTMCSLFLLPQEPSNSSATFSIRTTPFRISLSCLSCTLQLIDLHLHSLNLLPKLLDFRFLPSALDAHRCEAWAWILV